MKIMYTPSSYKKHKKYFVSDISYNPNNLVFKLLKMWKDEKKSVVVVPLIISQNLKSLTYVWVYIACCIITPTHTNSSKIVKISHTKMLLLFIKYHHAFLFNDRNKKIGECVLLTEQLFKVAYLFLAPSHKPQLFIELLRN